MRAAVLGAGIAGLATAHFLKQGAARRGMPLEVIVLESAPRAGGRIRTTEEAGYRVEWAANGIQGLPGAASRLVDDLGLTAERAVARPDAARRYIWKAGALHRFPLSPAGLARFRALSPAGTLRLLAEPLLARRASGDESVHDFAARHVGSEAASTLVGAAVRGIFAGDARRLSLDAAFPVMREMERKHRSLILAMIRGRRSPGGRTLWSLRGGMERLVEALARSVGDGLRLRTPALEVERQGEGRGARWAVRTASGERLLADAVMVAAPARGAAALVRGLDRDLARLLAEVQSASLAAVALGFRPESFRARPDGYGFLVVPGEPLEVLGALCETNLWPERAPEGRILIRVLIGGANRGDLLTRSDADLTALAMQALDRAWGLASGPERVWVIRQPESIPQYAVGHRAMLATVAGRLDLLPGLYLTGNAFRGVSVASLVEDAERVAGLAIDRLG